MGEDHFGNKFFEIPPDPSVGRRKSSRWFEPKEKEDFEQEMPAEWDAWLRGRRSVPPTDEEVARNVQIMNMKKHNAKVLDDKYGAKTDDKGIYQKPTGMGTFPDYQDEYELMPGKPRKKQ